MRAEMYNNFLFGCISGFVNGLLAIINLVCRDCKYLPEAVKKETKKKV